MSAKELDRREGGKDEFIKDEDARRATEAYVRLCVEVVTLAQSRDELAEWFQAEGERRTRYGLDEGQTGRIVLACQDQVERLKTRAVPPARIQRKDA